MCKKDMEAIKHVRVMLNYDDPLLSELEEMLSTGKKASSDKFVSIQENQLVNFLKSCWN